MVKESIISVWRLCSVKIIVIVIHGILDIIQFDTKTTDEEIEELKGYIEIFLNNVDNDYNWFKKIIKKYYNHVLED